MKRWTVARGLRRAVGAVAAASLLIGLAACGGGADQQPGGEATVAANPEGIDDGTKLTLWTRAPLEAQAKALVQAYNASHKNQVELTITPNDDYVTRVGAAAGSGSLPDLFAADIVYVPNWTEQGLFADISSRIDTLPSVAEINQGHLAAGTYEGKKYVLPFVLDLSVIFYNKELYKEAGLDPGQGPDHPGRVQGARASHPEAEQEGRVRHLLRRQLRWLRRLHLVPDDLGQRRAADERRRHRLEPQRCRRQAGIRDVARAQRGRRGGARLPRRRPARPGSVTSSRARSA